MGLMDFFKKGKEQPVEKKVNKPTQNTTRPVPSAPSQTSSPSQPSSSNVNTQPGGTTTRRDYTIQSGDSLSKIAKHFYGNASDWQKIYQANKDKIQDPNKIFPGQKIIIP